MPYQSIGIAGDPGAGKTELIKRLLKHPSLSGWKSCSTGDLLRARHALLEKQGIFKESFADYLAKGLTDEEIIILNKEARRLVKEGNCLLDSRYIVENCRNTKSLLVFLTAPIQVRMERKGKDGKNSLAEIKSDLQKRAAWELETGLRLFGYDYRDLSNYFLVLHTDRLTIDQEVEEIIRKLEAQPQYSPITIAISGLPGAGSTTTARLLTNKLNLEYFSPGRIFKDIGRGAVKQQAYYSLFKELCDSHDLQIPEVAYADDSHAVVNLWETDFGKNPDTHKIIDEVQRRHAKKGNVILDGKLSIHMLPQADYKIWLTGNLESRIPRTAQRDGLSIEASRELLTSRESQEAENWKKMYGFDYRTQEKDATLIIDTSNLSPEEVTDKILAHINNKSNSNF